jgi:hypothetical protein
MRSDLSGKNKPTMKPLFGIAILGATLSFLSAASYAQTPISSVPYTITAPGKYILSNDLLYSGESGNAITVNTSNVTINLNGFYIVCPNSNNANGVYANGQNHITVKNGEIIGFNLGVSFTATTLGAGNSAHLVDAVRFIRDSWGVYCVYGTACVVQNCQIVGGYVGVDFLQGTGNRATNNVVDGAESGFYRTRTDYFDSNYADSCSIGFDASSTTTRLRFNATTRCATGVFGGTSEGASDN